MEVGGIDKFVKYNLMMIGVGSNENWRNGVCLTLKLGLRTLENARC